MRVTVRIKKFLQKRKLGSLHMTISGDEISNVKTRGMVQIDEPAIS